MIDRGVKPNGHMLIDEHTRGIMIHVFKCFKKLLQSDTTQTLT